MVKVTMSASGVAEPLLARIPAAVRAVEQAVIASCEPFVPYRTGALCRSAAPAGEGTEGLVVYTAPYASLCYYAERPFRTRYHPQACAHWFEAARAVDLEHWAETAASVLCDSRAARTGKGG
ncbi:MAG: minor capsid protein [Eubacteriales bacterium]